MKRNAMQILLYRLQMLPARPNAGARRHVLGHSARL